MTLGTLPGVTIEQVGGTVGEGTSRLRYTPGSPGTIAMSGPNDLGVFGAEVPVGSDDTYLVYGRYNLSDSPWMRISVLTDFLPASLTEVEVFTKLRYGVLGLDDVTSSEASAGDVSTFTLTGTNNGTKDLLGVNAWIQTGAGIELSNDGVAWVTPTQLSPLFLAATLTPTSTVTLHIRRTIGIVAAADPKVPVDLRTSYFVAL